MKKFDLNIETILENWENYHAVREIIANALDEQNITKTKDIEIFKDSRGFWHIKDFGRGLKYEHLTQNENEEKLSDPNLIGKFGIGLKDALATFDRKKIRVLIKSKFGNITIDKSEKAGFDDIETLHALITETADKNFIGTEVIIENIDDSEIEKGKNLFLKFSGEEKIEETKYGEVLEKKGETSRIYINGVKVSEENNFLFSYNITSITSQIKKALNRERSNVGRSAYSDRIKKILLDCRSEVVTERLVQDLQEFETGYSHDENNWIDVQEYAIRILNSKKKIVFMTPSEIKTSFELVDQAHSGEYEIVTIPERLKNKIRGTKDLEGNLIRDINQFSSEYNESFEYQFVDFENLNPQEKEIFGFKDKIFDIIGGKPSIIQEILISETMVKDFSTFTDAFL